MSGTETTKPRKRRWRWTLPLLILASIVAALIAGGWAWYRYKFPYGQVHCCAKVLGFELRMYAEEHDGFFPRGRPTAEASLGLLYDGTNSWWFEILRGKSVPRAVTQEALEKKGALGPESCGWHYVEGLTLADDPSIAIVWDKVGLDHFGMRHKGGGHEVIFLGCSVQFVSGAEWPAFLENQKQLLADRAPEAVKGIPALVATIRLPTGQVLDRYDGPYELAEKSTSESGSGHGKSSGTGLELRWYRFVPDGQITFVLTLPSERLRSKPVTFTVKNRRASPSSVVFEMENY